MFGFSRDNIGAIQYAQYQERFDRQCLLFVQVSLILLDVSVTTRPYQLMKAIATVEKYMDIARAIVDGRCYIAPNALVQNVLQRSITRSASGKC